MPLMLRKKDKISALADKLLGISRKENENTSERKRLKGKNNLERRLASEETSQVKY